MSPSVRGMKDAKFADTLRSTLCSAANVLGTDRFQRQRMAPPLVDARLGGAWCVVCAMRFNRGVI